MTTPVLELLWEHNRLANEAYYSGSDIDLSDLKTKIKQLRGTISPPCWGDDDCSTQMLSSCPWSIDCGNMDS